jgi:hypothetical protein
MALGGNARGIDFDQRAAAGMGRRRRRRALPAAALFVAAPRPHPMNDVGDFALIDDKQLLEAVATALKQTELKEVSCNGQE